MTGYGKTFALLGTCATLLGPPLSAQTGSVLSDLQNEEVQARYRAAAAERIACPRIEGDAALMAAFAKDAASKWDRAAMGCATEYGARAMEALSLPTNLIWAVATFRTDNIETHLQVLGAHLDYFEVLDKSYSAHYQGIEMATELGLRWEHARERSETLMTRIDPLVPKLTEARLLRAAYLLASTLRETPPEVQNTAVAAALEDLQIAIAENPEALDGLGPLLLGQVLAVLPEFLGGDILAAIDLLEQAHALNPTDLSVHHTLVEAYLGERETDKALALLRHAASIDPSTENPQDYADEMKYLGGLALRAGAPDLARQMAGHRSAILAAHPQLDPRKEMAALGHGGADPLTGKKPDDLN